MVYVRPFLHNCNYIYKNEFLFQNNCCVVKLKLVIFIFLKNTSISSTLGHVLSYLLCYLLFVFAVVVKRGDQHQNQEIKTLCMELLTMLW